MAKNIALSIAQMKHLEELGLDTSDASMCWWEHNNWTELKAYSKQDLCEAYEKPEWKHLLIPSYTLQDILEKLPKEIEFKEMRFFLWWSGCVFSYSTLDDNGNYKGAYYEAFDHNGDSILEGAYDMLLWCIENNYIKTNK